MIRSIRAFGVEHNYPKGEAMKKLLVFAVGALLAAQTAFAQQGTRSASYQQRAGAAATQRANEATLKQGTPKLRVNTTTTTTSVYDTSVRNKKGTTDSVIVEQSVTNAQGQTTTDGDVYESFTPSKAARTNENRMELSVAVGETYSYNKDNRSDRYGSNGLAGNVNMLWHTSPHFALGVDYMALHPSSKTYTRGAESRNYDDIYLHAVSLGGKYTLNAWNNLRVYIPMGWGMMNARMKTQSGAARASHDKWGTGFYAGLGVQYDITARLFAGLEYRYTYAFISDKDLSSYGRDKDLQYHSAFLRVGMRF